MWGPRSVGKLDDILGGRILNHLLSHGAHV